MFTDASRGHKTFTSCINQVLLFTPRTTVVCTSTITVYLAPHKISTVLNTSNDQAQCYIILYWACYYSKLSGLREVEEVGRGMGGGGDWGEEEMVGQRFGMWAVITHTYNSSSQLEQI